VMTASSSQGLTNPGDVPRWKSTRTLPLVSKARKRSSKDRVFLDSRVLDNYARKERMLLTRHRTTCDVRRLRSLDMPLLKCRPAARRREMASKTRSGEGGEW
jgi:hypothetical protein